MESLALRAPRWMPSGILRCCPNHGTARANSQPIRPAITAATNNPTSSPRPTHPCRSWGLKSAADRYHRGAARCKDLSWQGHGDEAGRGRHRQGHRGDAQRAGAPNRGLLPGDVLYIYTGWGDNWKDPDTEKFYYTKGPGLAYDAAKYIEEKQVVLLALDNPFTDPVADGFLQGKASPPARHAAKHSICHPPLQLDSSGSIKYRTPLGALANDKVWVSCTMILPLRAQGNSGSQSAGGDRGARAIMGREQSIDGRYRVMTGPQRHLQSVWILIRLMSALGQTQTWWHQISISAVTPHAGCGGSRPCSAALCLV